MNGKIRFLKLLCKFRLASHTAEFLDHQYLENDFVNF